MKFSMKIDGLRELDAALAEFPKATARNVLKRAGTKAMQQMAETARRLAPDDPKTTGLDLHTSIAVSAKIKNDAGKAAYASVMRAGGSRADARAALVDSARANGQDSFVMLYMGPGKGGAHGVLQEFGTVNHGPQPFMRPAFDQHAKDVPAAVGRELKTEIAKAAERARRKALKAK